MKIVRNILIRQRSSVFAVLPLMAILVGLSGSARGDVENYQRTLNSTVWVLAKSSGETSSGTGVLVDSEKRLIVTNFHVVGEARSAVIFFPDVKDGQPVVERNYYLKKVKELGIRGRVVAADRKRDLALIELPKLPANAEALPLATDGIGPGEDIESVGNPGASGALWVYTSGTIRSVYQKEFRTGAGEHDFKVVETQAPINSGDSGGPVVNSRGELVAISQAVSPKARLVSYCVHVSEVKTFLESPWKPAPLPIDEVLELAELKFEKHESGHYLVEFDQKDDRKQTVYVAKEVEYHEQADVRKVWALAGTLKQAPDLETSLKLLQQSARTKIGAWTVEKDKRQRIPVDLLCEARRHGDSGCRQKHDGIRGEADKSVEEGLNSVGIDAECGRHSGVVASGLGSVSPLDPEPFPERPRCCRFLRHPPRSLSCAMSLDMLPLRGSAPAN